MIINKSDIKKNGSELEVSYYLITNLLKYMTDKKGCIFTTQSIVTGLNIWGSETQRDGTEDDRVDTVLGVLSDIEDFVGVSRDGRHYFIRDHETAMEYLKIHGKPPISGAERVMSDGETWRRVNWEPKISKLAPKVDYTR